MTRGSVREYVEALRERHRRARRREKGRMLMEFTQVTGYHRKAAIRLLRCGPRPPGRRRGRKRQYEPEVAAALKVVWKAADRVCSRRMPPLAASRRFRDRSREGCVFMWRNSYTACLSRSSSPTVHSFR